VLRPGKTFTKSGYLMGNYAVTTTPALLLPFVRADPLRWHSYRHVLERDLPSIAQVAEA